MARPYSYDLRQKAVEAVLKGAKRVEVSKLFGMSIRTIQRWLKMWLESDDYPRNRTIKKVIALSSPIWRDFANLWKQIQG